MGADATSSPQEVRPVVPRPASTIMVVRDGAGRDGRLEVLMLRRNLRADFVGGAYVFPGGSLDALDGGAEAEALADGLDDREASRRIGVPAGGLAYWVAAVRECFEEAGVLLARRAGGGPTVSFAEPDEAARFLRHRDGLNAGTATFVRVLREEALRLALDRIAYVAHWITPEGSPRRYDTRFFVAAAPAGQVAAHDAGETISDVWVRPAEALARHRSGEMAMILPTIRNLEVLAAFGTAAEALDAARDLRDVPAMLPRVVVGAGGPALLLPGDPGYDESRVSADPTDLDAAVRASSAGAGEEEGPGR
jgi:8-oxo-dGTP pyrophosphatase MutT (NUDIX family)